MRRYFTLFLGLCGICVFVSYVWAAQAEQEEVKGSLTLTHVQSDAGPLLEISVGDMVIRADRLSFMDAAGGQSYVYTTDQQLVLKQGKRLIKAKRVTVPLQNGILRQDGRGRS